MKDETGKFLERAEDCLSDADANFHIKRYVVVVNRSYYCIFDCVRGLLAEVSFQPKTHQGAYVKFNELFVKVGFFTPEHREIFRAVFDLRQSGDYDLDFEPTEQDAAFALNGARRFLTDAKTFLRK